MSFISEIKTNTVIGNASLEYDIRFWEKMLNLPKFVPGKKENKVNFREKEGLTATISKRGKVMIYGGKSLDEQRNLLNSMLCELDSHNIKAKLSENLKICSMGMSGKLKNRSLNLEKIVRILQPMIKLEYEPEQFPAVIVKPTIPKCTILLFSNGSFVVQGVKTPSEGEKIINEIIGKIEQS